MSSLILPLLLLVGLIPLVLALLRANELFCLRMRQGRLKIVRGRLPQRLLDDIDDILRRPAPAEEVTVRVVVEERAPRVYVEGELTDAQRQQLRNTVSMWPVPKIRNAPKP
ncbi:MAG: DUF3634 family protein [Polyangiaceae bacterium]|nr:DUF3634 family protein [Polyangiaceae bacterium]NUQ72797.1 DUF3634 family protein [Polyangiaceae bacterium]